MTDWEKQRKAFKKACKEGTFTITEKRQKEILGKMEEEQRKEGLCKHGIARENLKAERRKYFDTEELIDRLTIYAEAGGKHKDFALKVKKEILEGKYGGY